TEPPNPEPTTIASKRSSGIDLPRDRVARVRLVGAERARSDSRVQLAAETPVQLANPPGRESDRAGHAHARALGRGGGAPIRAAGQLILDEVHLGASAGCPRRVARALRLLDRLAEVRQAASIRGARRVVEGRARTVAD